MIRPLAALVTSVALSVLGPVATAAAMPSPELPEAHTKADPGSEAGETEESEPVIETDPIQITIEGVSPSVVPQQGPITMSGRVTNTSDEAASDINIHPLTSYSPMTTTEEITAATEADPEVYFGDRIISVGSFATLDELAPGATKRWKLQIPQSDLSISGTQGVYQIGVQVRAPSEDGDRVTVGRARTLIPLMDRGSRSVPTSVVVPMRGPVDRDAEGRLEDPDQWSDDVARGGRLRNLADFVDAAGDVPVTWLVDPAIPEAVEQLSTGNPARDLDPTDGEEPEIETSDPETAEGSSTAEAWLADVASQATDRTVLALPYGDLDVAAAQRHAPALYERSRAMSTRALTELDISHRPAVVPPSGHLPTGAFDMFEDDEQVLLSSEAVATPDGVSTADTASFVEVDGHRVTLTDAKSADTASNLSADALAHLDPELDPETTPPTPASVRQRILSEAAVRSLAGSREGLVVNLPEDFDPGPRSTPFFTGINRSFIDLTPLAANGAGTTAQTHDLSYPAREQRAEVHSPAFTAADDLVLAGAALDGILARTDQVERQVTAQALTTLSYATREDDGAAEARAESATRWIESRLDQITIDAPSFVILSAESGPFAVTVTNGLDQPVTLSLSATTPADVDIAAPETVNLEANASQTVQMTASTNSIGVHSVELRAADAQGNPLGSGDRLSIRSNAVGNVIWVVMGVGVGILFVAILLRWTRRIRGGRSSE